MNEHERLDSLRTALFDAHILPCPVCGLDGCLDWHDGNFPKPTEQIDVRCDCGVCGPLAWTSSAAIARWNMPLWRKWRTENALGWFMPEPAAAAQVKALFSRPRTDLDNDGWLQTITGEPFWLVGARPIEFDIRVIAWSLSMQPRFNGHQRRFHSIAHHSLLVVNLLEGQGASMETVLVGLLHDAVKAYTTDLIRPLKRALPEFKERIELPLEHTMSTAFGLPWPWPDAIKEADNRALAIERAHLLAPSPRPWRGLPDIDPNLYDIRPELPGQMALDFVREFEALT